MAIAKTKIVMVQGNSNESSRSDAREHHALKYPVQCEPRGLAHVTRVLNGLVPVVKPNGVDASGVLINPRLKLAALRAARDHIDQAIASIERKWPVRLPLQTRRAGAPRGRRFIPRST